MVFNLSVLELVFIWNARVFCAFTTTQASPGKRKFEELLPLKGWTWHILTVPLPSKYCYHVTLLLWISHGQTGTIVFNSHRDSAFRSIFSANKQEQKWLTPIFIFLAAKRRLPFDSMIHRTRVIFPTGKLDIYLLFVEKVVTIHGESRLVAYLKMGNIVKEFFKRALKLFYKR